MPVSSSSPLTQSYVSKLVINTGKIEKKEPQLYKMEQRLIRIENKFGIKEGEYICYCIQLYHHQLLNPKVVETF